MRRLTRTRLVPAAAMVVGWEDDPGDPARQPSRVPISVAAPNPAARPLPFKIRGRSPRGAPQPGTPAFRYAAAAVALRRTADFWGALVPAGTTWRVGRTLGVGLDDGVDLNAFYTRGGYGDTPGLHFFHDEVGGRTFYSGESPDVACHEMGHAVLDALRPQLFNAQTIEAAAFHESFGDMSAMLSALQVPSFRRVVLSETRGTLTRSSRLSRVAEQLGAAIRAEHPDAVDPDCLRNAANSFFYRDPQTLPPLGPAAQLSSEPHSFSRVFTGAFLDALAGLVKAQGAPTPDVLARAARDAGRLLVAAVRAAPIVPDYYSQVAAHMVRAGAAAPFHGRYRDGLTGAFVRRGILSLPAVATLAAAGPARPPAATLRAVPGRASGELPTAKISGAAVGLPRAALVVHAADEVKRLAVTSSSLTLGPVEPCSPEDAAEAFTEDLFQRGRVDVRSHVDRRTGMTHPLRFKTHVLVVERRELTLKRRTFDCGFD